MNHWKSQEIAATGNSWHRCKQQKHLRDYRNPPSSDGLEQAIWNIGNHWKQLTPLKTPENWYVTGETTEFRWALLKKLYELLETTGTRWHRWNRRKPLNPQNSDWFYWKGYMNALKSLETADTAENRRRKLLKTMDPLMSDWIPIGFTENAICIIGNHWT